MSLKQPVKYPVKYYSHLDTGAPQLANADGVIKTILKACLVTGYGTKEGAGWTALFDDAFRIVLRRPLRTGTPPDIKIENGIINGTASHRIVSQDDPTGLDDAVELAAVNLLARDSKHGSEWHLIVSDFGFLLCYQIGESANNDNKNNMFYVGSSQKIIDADPDYFITMSQSVINRDGTGVPWLRGFLDASSIIKNMRTNDSSTQKNILSLSGAELSVVEYFAQPIILNNKNLLPFYCSAFSAFGDVITQTITVDSRPMLRYVNRTYSKSDANRAIYIPIDYWEL